MTVETAPKLETEGYVCIADARSGHRQSATISEVSGRWVTVLSRSGEGLWSTRLRGQKYRGTDRDLVFRAICANDRAARATLGQRGADTVKFLMNLYEDKTFNRKRGVCEFVVNRILQKPATTYSEFVGEDLLVLHDAARAWGGHFTGRKNAQFDGVPIAGLTGLAVADAIGEMTDQGIVTLEKAAVWFDTRRQLPVSTVGAEVQEPLGLRL